MNVCLGIGLVLHDLDLIHSTLGGDGNQPAADQSGVPKHLLQLKLNWAHLQTLLQVCLNIERDLNICLGTESPESNDAGSELQDANPPPPSKKRKTHSVKYVFKYIIWLTIIDYHDSPKDCRRSRRLKLST